MSDFFTRRRFRHWLADWLSYLACRLRGQKWYVADSFGGVPCNRASELEQQIQVWCVMAAGDTWQLSEVEPQLQELAQLANANWGHIWPKAEVRK